MHWNCVWLIYINRVLRLGQLKRNPCLSIPAKLWAHRGDQNVRGIFNNYYYYNNQIYLFQWTIIDYSLELDHQYLGFDVVNWDIVVYFHNEYFAHYDIEGGFVVVGSIQEADYIQEVDKHFVEVSEEAHSLEFIFEVEVQVELYFVQSLIIIHLRLLLLLTIHPKQDLQLKVHYCLMYILILALQQFLFLQPFQVQLVTMQFIWKLKSMNHIIILDKEIFYPFYLLI